LGDDADAAELGEGFDAAVREGDAVERFFLAVHDRGLRDVGEERRGQLGELLRRLEGGGDQPEGGAEDEDEAAEEPGPGDDVGPVPAVAAAAAGEEGRDAHGRSPPGSPRRARRSWARVRTTRTAPIRIEAAAARPGFRS